MTLSITNIGLRTFDGACDVRFYTSNGDRYVTCTQYRRKDISGARDRLDLTIGPNHLASTGRTCRLKINEKNLQLDMTLKGVLPEFQFGGNKICAGIIGDGAQLIPARSFLFRPLRSRKDETSGFQRPIAFEVSIKSGGYWINGTIKEERFLDSVDVMGQLSWPTRTLIKTFYTKPYLIRYLAVCDLNLTDRDGVQHPISGPGLVGTNFY